MSYGDNSGEAALTMRVAGERGAFDVPLSLKKSQGRWSVVYARAINEEGEAVVIVCHVLAVAPDTEGRIVGDEVFGRRDGLSFFLDAHRVSDGQDPRLFAGEEAVLRRGQVANLTG